MFTFKKLIKMKIMRTIIKEGGRSISLSIGTVYISKRKSRESATHSLDKGLISQALLILKERLEK